MQKNSSIFSPFQKGATPQKTPFRHFVAKGATPQKTPFRHFVAKGANPQNACILPTLAIIGSTGAWGG